MNILVVGGGGREHALCWKIAQSPLTKKLYCAPGNPGIAREAECVRLKVEDNIGILQFCREKKIDLVVIGPEGPLCSGMSDELRDSGFKVFGPSKVAAELEGSKVFCKKVLHKHAIPTAAFKVFDDAHDAHDYIDAVGAPIVVKADGLAMGKGAIVCATLDKAHEAIKQIMEDRVFGLAGNRVVIEECLRGEEASFLAITDGRTIIPLEAAQDHKPIFDGDKGPNTGGMGAYSPIPRVSDKLRNEVVRKILVPTVHAMRTDGRKYQGLLYAGLMLTDVGPQVIEYNIRWGDPEAQPLLMRIKNDIVPVFLAVAEGKLENQTIEWDDRTAICVVMASGGYPGSYEKGKEISGLDDARRLKDVMVFHAGTAMSDGKVVTNGGRVLGVTALGKNVSEAQAKAYEACALIHWEGVQYRKDIGDKALT
jgi:phosphoribosylamine---glycine ligase